MFIYLAAFVITLVSLLMTIEIVLLTKETLDRSYKFFMWASIVLTVVIGFRLLVAADIVLDNEYVKYLDFLYVLLFMDGLIYMRRLVKEIRKKK